MTFKIDPMFERYWPPLPGEKFIILEKSILEEGLRDNLIVWKEKNILLDGHQRLRVLKKHGISFEDRITYLSFTDEIHAKHWVHVTQAARRGDAPQFLSICHVLEFEPIYQEEARLRRLEGEKKGGLARHGKPAPGINDTTSSGPDRSRTRMAEDSCAGENSITRVLYIREHDPKLSSRAIAELAGVGKNLVEGMRPVEVVEKATSRTGQDAGRKGRSTRAGEKVIWDDRKSQFARTSHARGGEGPVES